jgi:hypothetical protein
MEQDRSGWIMWHALAERTGLLTAVLMHLVFTTVIMGRMLESDVLLNPAHVLT